KPEPKPEPKPIPAKPTPVSGEIVYDAAPGIPTPFDEEPSAPAAEQATLQEETGGGEQLAETSLARKAVPKEKPLSQAMPPPVKPPPPVVTEAPEQAATMPAFEVPNDEEIETAVAPAEMKAGDVFAQLLAVMQSRPEAEALLSVVKLLRAADFRDGVLYLGYEDGMPSDMVERVQSAESNAALDHLLGEAVGVANPKVVVKRWLDEDAMGLRNDVRHASAEVRTEVSEKPFVKDVCKIFKGEVIEVVVKVKDPE
ncbi:MAG: hypothetical protein KAI66_02330, partial [Lentisphaeria bacterium]|nr:hypothetical protein [Lentisphaeria bacterium]